jgi:uncharacterized protein YecE (DUF72 family)
MFVDVDQFANTFMEKFKIESSSVKRQESIDGKDEMLLNNNSRKCQSIEKMKSLLVQIPKSFDHHSFNRERDIFSID